MDCAFKINKILDKMKKNWERLGYLGKKGKREKKNGNGKDLDHSGGGHWQFGGWRFLVVGGGGVRCWARVWAK